MNEEHLSKLFRPFEQVGDVKRRAEGTGLGLAISRRLVQMMGSDIEVKSELGKGSTISFEVTLPVVEVQAESRQATERIPVSYKGERRKVLIVDDKSYNRSVIINLLEPLGFEVVEAEDGKQEVEKAKQLRPDLIITDLVMPVMTGFEAVEEIRKIAELKDTPIIAVSASVFGMDQQQSRMAGCNDFLPKPINVKRLFGIIQHLLKFEWTYEEPVALPEPAKVEALDESALPPVEELTMLYNLAKSGKVRQILKWTTQFEQSQVKYKPLVNKLQELAKQFQDKAIVALLEQYIKN